jgi:hypothetical protein
MAVYLSEVGARRGVMSRFAAEDLRSLGDFGSPTPGDSVTTRRPGAARLPSAAVVRRVMLAAARAGVKQIFDKNREKT